MLIALTWAALRRRPFSLICTILLGITWSAFLRVPAPAAMCVWVLTSLFVLELWLVFEPFILERLGCRSLAPREQDRLTELMRHFNISVRIANDSSSLWVGGALRTVVVSRGAFEQLDDAALHGLVAQAALRQRSPILLREIVVWLGNAPILVAWCMGRGLALLGRLVALALGSALVLPLLLW
ncbi:MAG TPA: hypothetical protein VFG86_13290, partial [Chloroflexota bacterium]|nr:hypothetical protein [Chloroflexota bacterium]